jgi:hypothetical protein
MNKRGLILKIIAIVFIASLALGIYLYNYRVYKTMRVCITEDVIDTQAECSEDLECVNKFKKENKEFSDKLETSPDFIKTKLLEAIEGSVYCDVTCKNKEICGDLVKESCKNETSCEEGEKEILIQIRGSDLTGLARFLKDNPSLIGKTISN